MSCLFFFSVMNTLSKGWHLRLDVGNKWPLSCYHLLTSRPLSMHCDQIGQLCCHGVALCMLGPGDSNSITHKLRKCSIFTRSELPIPSQKFVPSRVSKADRIWSRPLSMSYEYFTTIPQQYTDPLEPQGSQNFCFIIKLEIHFDENRTRTHAREMRWSQITEQTHSKRFNG